MKKFLAILFIVLISVLVCSSLVKLIKNLLMNENSKNTSQIIANNHFLPKWVKRDYLLPNGSWVLKNPDQPLVEGKKYFLIQSVLHEEKCYFGMFFLKKIQKNALMFKTEKFLSVSRLMQYSSIKSLKITTVISSEEDLPIFGKMQNCNEWIKIANH